MKIESFVPSEYTSPCGTIRVRKHGTLWRAEVQDELADGTHRWGQLLALRTRKDTVPVEALTHLGAIAMALVELGLEEPDDPPTERDDWDGF